MKFIFKYKKLNNRYKNQWIKLRHKIEIDQLVKNVNCIKIKVK